MVGVGNGGPWEGNPNGRVRLYMILVESLFWIAYSCAGALFICKSDFLKTGSQGL